MKTAKEVKKIRKQYPIGTRVVVDHMGDDDPAPVKDGTRGVVKHVDDIGTLHCDFEDGRQLGLVIGVDRFHVEIMPRWKKTCLCLSDDDFHSLLEELYPDVKWIVVHYDLDGLWVSSEEDDEWGPDTQELGDKIGDRFGIQVTSIHIDDCDETGVWIVYKEVSE